MVQSLAGQNPSHVGPPGAFARRVRVAFTIGLLVVDAVRGDPEDRSSFERERPAEGQKVFNPLVGLVAAVRQQTMVGHADAEHAADEIKNQGGEQSAFRHEEQRGNRTDVKRPHSDRGYPVDPLLILAPIHERRLHHEIRPPAVLLSEKCSRTITTPRAADCKSSVLFFNSLREQGIRIDRIALPPRPIRAEACNCEMETVSYTHLTLPT